VNLHPLSYNINKNPAYPGNIDAEDAMGDGITLAHKEGLHLSDNIRRGREFKSGLDYQTES
jgi:hypothetical protein